MYYYVNKQIVLISKKFAFDEIYVYFKTGLPAFIVLLLCFVFQPSLKAQDAFVMPASMEFNQDSIVNNKNNDTIAIIDSQPQDTVKGKKQFYFALKNNLLYDAALLPNLTFEAYLGKQFSLAIEGNWSWWSSNKNIESAWFYRIQSVGAELRYWINSPYPLQGHAVGIYSMVGNYDVRLFAKNENSKGQLSYETWSAGLSYAYSVPVAKRVNMEFGFAMGYLSGKYHDYNYCMMHERWEQQAKFNRKYFGPTRVGVSVVWQFGNGNNTRNRGVTQ